MNNTREKAATNAGKINDTKFSLKDGNVHIFPFIIRNGYQNVTEVGFVDKGENPYWYSFFQKVFTGRETITATWEGSTQLNVRDASLGTYNYDFTVGKYYEGMIVPGSHTQTMEINDVNGNDGFLAMQESGDITIVFSRNENEENDTDFIPTEEDLFKLYIIPESNFENKWLYISNVTTYNNPKNKANILTEVTFTSLKDKLETSGRALEQYVQYAAPGEPYAFPYITLSGDVIVSPLRLNVEPVKYVQVELQGASAFSSVTVLGRRLYWDSENLKWYTSPGKFLLPYRFVIPQANPLAKTCAPTKNFYCFPNEEVETRSTAEWLESIKKQASELAPIQNMGSFTMSGTWTSGVHSSNPINATSNHHSDYNDTTWKPLTGYSSLPSWSVPGNVYCEDTVALNANDSMIQILIKNSMVNMTQLELPLSMKQTRPYRWSNIPVIGFWTRWFGDRAIKQNTTNVSTHKICYFIDTNLATMQYNAFTQSGTAYGNLQMFSGEDAPAGLNPQAANTTICFEITDMVSHLDTVTNTVQTIDTVYLSQVKDENGNWLHTDHSPVLLNCGTNDLSPQFSDYGFVIDSVVVNALHIGKIKISCYGTEGQTLYGATYSPQFTQTVMSNSMFEQNNIRNWTTDITLGTWDSNWSEGDITWPLAPQKEIYSSFPIDITQSAYTYNQGDAIINTPTGFTYDSALTYLERDETIYEQGVSYNQIDGEVHTKAEFLAKYSKLAFDLTGSSFKFKLDYNEHQRGQWLNDFDLNNVCDGKQYVIADLNNIVDNVLTVDKSIFALNNNDYTPIFPHTLSNDSLTLVRYINDEYPWKELITRTNAGMNNWLRLELTFGDSSVTIKVIDKCKFSGYGWSAKTTETKLAYSQGKDYIGRATRSNLHFQIKIPKVYLIEKES